MQSAEGRNIPDILQYGVLTDEASIRAVVVRPTH